MNDAPAPLVSPLAVPFPAMPALAGVELATARAGFYKEARDDLLLMRFAPGTTAAGVFTRHGVGSAPVDWCKAALAAGGGEDVRGLVVNAGCANSFTGAPGAAAARSVVQAVAKSIGCREQAVLTASTGVIGVLLDATRVAAQMPALAAGLSSTN